MTVQTLESAWIDLRRGYRFYEGQESGVGDYFLDTLFGEIDSLSLYAGIHDDVALVYAVLDCRRDPSRIAERLSSA